MRTPSRIGRSILVGTVMILVGSTRLWAQRPAVVDTLVPADSVLVAYFRTLRFLRDHASSDARPLDWMRPGRREAARVEPEASVFSDTTGGGRVAARIVNLGNAVPRFGLYRGGITYLWIQDDREPPYAVYISTNSAGRIVHRARAALLPWDSTYHTPEIRLPLARWQLSSDATMRANAICLVRCKTAPWCMTDSLRSSSRRLNPETSRPPNQ